MVSLQTTGVRAHALRMLWLVLAGTISSTAVQAVPAGTGAASQPDRAASAANGAQPALASPVSTAGQRIYEQLRPRLLQVRTLLKTQDSQSSVGSGFLVSDSGHLITNFHVVSQYALQPKRNRLVYATADGQQGPLQLLAIDVLHDLALLKAADPRALAGRGAVPFRPGDATPALSGVVEPSRGAAGEPQRGAAIFALGNPLDVGFAVTEGMYNGLVERSFIPTLFFGGSLSPGMSGGPAVDESGRVVGVNVATRRDGEQVSFLVPGQFARALFERAREAQPIVEPVYPELVRQLQEHSAALTARIVAQPWRAAGHARYRIPVPQEEFMRCWGQGSPQSTRGLQYERSDCAMDSRIFVGGPLVTGHVSVRHETYDGSKIGFLRFAQRYSASFRNEHFGIDSRQLTAPQCTERTIDRAGLPLRTVMCLAGYKKLPGLYTLGVLVTTLDQPTAGAQGRFDASGVTFDDAMRLARHYLDGFAWTEPKTASR